MTTEPTIIEKLCHRNSYSIQEVRYGQKADTQFKNYIALCDMTCLLMITIRLNLSFSRLCINGITSRCPTKLIKNTTCGATERKQNDQRPIWWDFAHTTEPDAGYRANSQQWQPNDRDKSKAMAQISSLDCGPTIIKRKTICHPNNYSMHRNPTMGKDIPFKNCDWFKYHKPLDGYDRIRRYH